MNSAFSSAQMLQMLKSDLQEANLCRSMAFLSLNSSCLKYWLRCWVYRKGLMLITTSLVWLCQPGTIAIHILDLRVISLQPLLFGRIPLWAAELVISLSLLMETWRQGCAVACRGLPWEDAVWAPAGGSSAVCKVCKQHFCELEGSSFMGMVLNLTGLLGRRNGSHQQHCFWSCCGCLDGN